MGSCCNWQINGFIAPRLWKRRRNGERLLTADRTVKTTLHVAWQPPDEMKNWIGVMEMLRVYLFFVQACQFINIYEMKISFCFLKTGFSLNQPERAAVSDWLESHTVHENLNLIHQTNIIYLPQTYLSSRSLTADLFQFIFQLSVFIPGQKSFLWFTVFKKIQPLTNLLDNQS